MTIWVLAEMFRDRRDSGERRFSARQGCERLQEHLRRSFVGGRILPFNTIHGKYKKFETLRRRPEGKEYAALADVWLETSRANREILGWDASTWMAVIDPAELDGMGHK